MRSKAAQCECSSSQTRDLEHAKVVVTLHSLGGAKLELGALPRNYTIRQVRDLVREHLGVRIPNWTLLHETEILGDNGMTLAQVSGRGAQSLQLTVVRNAGPKFISCTRNAWLSHDGLAFRGPWDEDTLYSWALVDPSVASLTVRLGPMNESGSSYILGVVPQKFMETRKPGAVRRVEGVCLLMSGSGSLTGKVKVPRQPINRNAKPLFAQSTFEDGDFVTAEFDRHGGMCRFGRGDPDAGVEWSKNFKVDFDGQLGIGLAPHGHAVICA